MGVDLFSDNCATLQSVCYLLRRFGTVHLYLLSSCHILTPRTKLAKYRDALIYEPFLFVMIRLSLCAFMSMYVFFVRYSFAIFLIPDILSQTELTR